MDEWPGRCGGGRCRVGSLLSKKVGMGVSFDKYLHDCLIFITFALN